MRDENQSEAPEKKRSSKNRPGILWRILGGLLKVLRKILKWLLWLLLFLIVFILCGGLGPFVTYVGAPIARMLNIPVSVERCVILPVTGYVRIEKLKIGNPKKFEEVNQAFYGKTPLLELGSFEFDFVMRTLFSEVWEIENIELTGLRMLYAIEEDTSNIDALIAQMISSGASAPAATEAPAAAPAEPEALPNEPEAEPTPEAPAETEALPSEPEAEPTPEAPAETKSPIHKIKVNRLHLADNCVTVRRYVSIPVSLPGLTLHNLDNYTLKEQYEIIVKPVKEKIDVVMTGIGVVGDALDLGAEDVSAVATGAIHVIGAAVDAVLPEANENIGEVLKAGVDGINDAGLRDLGKDVKDVIKFW